MNKKTAAEMNKELGKRLCDAQWIVGGLIVVQEIIADGHKDADNLQWMIQPCLESVNKYLIDALGMNYDITNELER